MGNFLQAVSLRYSNPFSSNNLADFWAFCEQEWAEVEKARELYEWEMSKCHYCREENPFCIPCPVDQELQEELGEDIPIE